MLTLKHIHYEVHDKEHEINILSDISLDIATRKFIVITGPNGGGKSTIAKLIAGVIAPTSGQILWQGEDITETSITERAHLGIGYALQQPVCFKGIGVKDLLQIAAGRELSDAQACDYLSKVGLRAQDYVHRDVNASLSGGELKRIEIATILARKPLLAIFDEPEAGIDLWSFQSLIQVFRQMRAEIADSSILVISHQERILEIADEIIVVVKGRIEHHGTREEILPYLIGSPATA